MTGHVVLGWLVLTMLAAPEAVNSFRQQRRSASARSATEDVSPIVIHAFDGGLSGVRAAKTDVKLRVDRDPSQGDEPLLFVEYPAPGADPGGRDVRCEAVNHDWSRGKAIAFRVKPSHAVRLSVSFFDRNHVVYTSWVDLKGNEWQGVRISFAEMRPNPYFQPPDARTGAPIDVSDVAAVAFAPHDQTPGQMAISRFVVVE